ncbi:carcinine transporter [Contarinia nasturtii]|uniref:carcinine transporter n=1 Tax=Contarinia nasturtii TaxID=265458 RepID=UPI0012D41F72|nr:carcinine transporter [Contarinia nasturtii]
MYDVNWTTIQSWDYENWNSTRHHEKLNVLDCDVREFDKQWYQSTIVSQEDWVCSKDMYQTNTFALNRIGEVIGTFFFGQLGDRFGRKIIFYVSVSSIVLGRVAMMFTTSHFTWFSIVSVFGSFCAISLFQSPFIIAMEISKPDDRANVAIIQNLAWTLGLCILPFIYWIVGDWFSFFVITSLPLLIFIFIPTYMIESPRWLANRGKLDKAAHYLNRIAKINKKSIHLTEKGLRTLIPNDEPEKIYGMLSLFSGFRLAKNTTILIICWMICTLAYFTLILYISQADGNPFLNFFIQSAIEAPAFFLGTYMANTLGRRWTNSFSFILASLFCIPTIILANYVEWEYIATCSVIVVKFWLAITFFVINLQAMETYPTCLRQTGLSIGTIGSNIIGILGPYIVYLGTKYDSRYPIMILFALCLIGSIAGLFLPETLYQKLPDSMAEARMFGADQKFWSLPKRSKESAEKEKNHNITADELERLNPLL